MRSIWLTAVLVTAGWSLSCTPRTGGTPVPLGVFLTKARPGLDVPDVVPAISVALDHIQNHSCILQGFKLELIYKDTACSSSLGMKALFELIASRPRPVALFGGMCTEVNEPVAMALKYWEMVQLSYAETHAKFSGADASETYPTFFRIVPGHRSLNNAKCRLIEHFRWKKVGTIKQSDEPRYSLPHESLTARLEHGFGIRVAYTAGVALTEAANIGIELEALKAKDVRILVLDAAEEVTVRVLCEAYRRQMYGDAYVWILPGFHNTQWMKKEWPACSQHDLATVLQGHFAVEYAEVRQDMNTVVVSGNTAGEVWEELRNAGNGGQYMGYLYDGLWALAIALAQALGPDAAFSHSRLMNGISNSSFEGVTGRVRFENNERMGLTDVKRWKDGKFELIAQFDSASDVFNVDEDALEGWTPPLDATIIVRERQYIAPSLFYVMAFLADAGVLLAVIFLILNIRHRAHRFIKMSSPNLNNLIIIGCICTFASVVLLGIDTDRVGEDSFVGLCYARTWTLCIGFTLSFGSMFSKTWRVHSIFTNIRMDRKAIKDSKLFLVLAGLLAVDFVVLSLWALFSPFSLRITELPKIVEDNRMIIPELERCYSEHSLYFQAALYAFKGVLMLLGCFLAWETRHVNVPALNDSKYIGMSVYCVVVMSTLGLSISVIMQERVNEAYALTSFFIIISTALTLCLVFVPKVVELVRNPQGLEQRGYRRGLMKSVVSKSSQHSQQLNSVRDVDKDLLAKAESENLLRRRYLHQKSTQLWDLLAKLKEHGDTQFLQQDWCFALGNAAVDDRRDTSQDHETSLLSNGASDWPWADPDEPSTML